MKKFMRQSIRDWKSLNNQNDPPAFELMRRNRDKYGVPIRKQFTHSLNAFWILPLVGISAYITDHVTAVFQSPGNKLVAGLICTGGFIYAVYRFVQSMEESDPVEHAKRDARPKLVMPQSGTLPSRAKLIVADDGKVYDLEGKYVTTLT